MVITPEGSYDKLFKIETLKVDCTTKIQKVTFFWFVSSKGMVQTDYLERNGLSQHSIKYLKLSDNFFMSKNDADNKLNTVMGTL